MHWQRAAMTTHAITVIEAGRTIAGRPDQSILDACLDAGIAMGYNCRSGECGECLSERISGEIHELPGADPAIFSNDQRAGGQMLTCMCYPRSDVVLSAPLQSAVRAAIREFDTVVTEVRPHGAAIIEVMVESDAMAETALNFAAGQYFEWVIPGIAPNRSYSAANRPGSNRLEFHVRLYQHGEVSRRLSRAEIARGDILTLKGPYGSFGLTPYHERPAILVAGGTGFAPMCSVLDEAAQKRLPRSFRFFYGTRRADDLYRLDKLELWRQRGVNLEFIPVLSDEPAGSGWTGERGLVTDAIKRRFHDGFGAEAYLCGPPPMIDAAMALLEGVGIDRSDMHFDKFTPVV